MEESDDRDLIIVDEAALPHGLARWLPTTVVLAAVAGFMALAWYAYHAGSQSVKDGDLLVVEADKTPVKEKPVDPGGMQFPDQDKTIFDTFSGKPDVPPKVERIVPPPEEPMPAQLDTSGTSTFVNPDVHQDTEKPSAPARSEQARSEQIIAPAPEAKKPAAPAHAPMITTQSVVKAVPPDVVAGQAPAAGGEAETYSAVKPSAPAPAAMLAPKPVVKAEPAPQKPTKPTEKPAEKPAPKALDGGGVAVQLGAYRSEAEAHASWAAMVKKNSDLLSGKERLIVKADLGARGIYYRLRVPGFENTIEAKAFCDKLAARKQACILPSGN